jgi:hypothetical protein
MDDFDRHLEQELSRVLDPIVCAQAPRRSGSWRDGRRGRGLRALIGGLPDGGPDPILVTEPVAIPVPVSIGSPSSAC